MQSNTPQPDMDRCAVNRCGGLFDPMEEYNIKRDSGPILNPTVLSSKSTLLPLLYPHAMLTSASAIV